MTFLCDDNKSNIIGKDVLYDLSTSWPWLIVLTAVYRLAPKSTPSDKMQFLPRKLYEIFIPKFLALYWRDPVTILNILISIFRISSKLRGCLNTLCHISVVRGIINGSLYSVYSVQYTVVYVRLSHHKKVTYLLTYLLSKG